MMRISTGCRLALIAAAGFSVSGCLNGGSGGGGGGGGGSTPTTPGEYQDAYDRVTGMIPTSDMPTSLDATYTGAARVDLMDTNTGATRGEAFADLSLDVDWTDGQTTNPWSGTASNIRGTFDGTDFAATGEMTTARAEAAGFSGTVGRTTSTIPLPTGGSVDVAAGAASINLVGDLDVDGNSDEVLLSLGGNFVGTEGAAMHGAAQAVWFDTSTGFGDIQGAGTFYAER